jgi:hypothetical protein
LPLRIWIFWALFLVRGTFYSTMLPLWEGWDEYAHMAWITHWSDHGTLPRTTDTISREIDESMRLAPLPRELRWIGPPYLIHSDWWALPVGERETRARSLAALSPALAHQAAVAINGRPFVFYEAQQPPLFYWIAAAVSRPEADRPLRERIHLLRLLSVFLASLAIPFTFVAARGVFKNGGGSPSHSAALLAVAPGLAIDSARVANDGLAIGVAALFLWLMARENSGWIGAGLTLGAAILVKASLLVLAPILVICWLRRSGEMALALSLGFAIGGWWYVRNLLIGVPLAGWQESVSLNTLAVSAIHLIRTGGWVNGAQTVAKSFTWFGAWSFMTLRTWMYIILEACAMAAMLAGLAARRAAVLTPAVFAGCFSAAIALGAAAYYAVHGIPGIPGWYLWPAGGATAILIVAGAGRFSIAFAAMLALTDLFGAACRMMPYYAGLAAWNHGSVTQFPLAADRLHVSIWLAIAWIASTIAIPVFMFQGRAKKRE